MFSFRRLTRRLHRQSPYGLELNRTFSMLENQTGTELAIQVASASGLPLEPRKVKPLGVFSAFRGAREQQSSSRFHDLSIYLTPFPIIRLLAIPLLPALLVCILHFFFPSCETIMFHSVADRPVHMSQSLYTKSASYVITCHIFGGYT